MMIPDFIVRALIAGLLVALMAAPMGCFVVWRRMSYFGDTLAHSALLGLALGLLFEINLQFSVIACCVVLAVLLVSMETRKTLSTDTILGILAHSSLAAGLILISFSDVQVNLMSYLFGDLLTVGNVDLVWILACAVLIYGVLYIYWNKLLAVTLHQELAQVEGINVQQTRLILMLMIALLVAVSMKIIGVLLITSLLIIPPASVRGFAKSPEQMALFAGLLGCLAVILGMAMSFYWDTPTGPSIVVAAAFLFLASALLNKKNS